MVKFGDDCGLSQQISSAGILRQPLQADSWNSHWKACAFHAMIIINCRMDFNANVVNGFFINGFIIPYHNSIPMILGLS